MWAHRVATSIIVIGCSQAHSKLDVQDGILSELHKVEIDNFRDSHPSYKQLQQIDMPSLQQPECRFMTMCSFVCSVTRHGHRCQALNVLQFAGAFLSQFVAKDEWFFETTEPIQASP